MFNKTSFVPGCRRERLGEQPGWLRFGEGLQGVWIEDGHLPCLYSGGRNQDKLTLWLETIARNGAFSNMQMLKPSSALGSKQANASHVAKASEWPGLPKGKTGSGKETLRAAYASHKECGWIAGSQRIWLSAISLRDHSFHTVTGL